jgi:selenocysteine lyase/cysteine desulfurase
VQGKGYRVAGSTRPGERSAIVSFTREDVDTADLSRRLAAHRVAHIVTHGRPKLSPHFYNTADEIDAALACL